MSASECAACVDAIDRQRTYEIVTESVKEGECCILDTQEQNSDHGVVKRVGISQSEYTWSQRLLYFNQVAKSFHLIRSLTCDPLGCLISTLQADWPQGQVSVAREDKIEGSPTYFAGILRQVNHGTFAHFDFARFHAGEEWTVGRTDAQLSWNIFLTQPESEGSTIVYDRQWEPAFEQARASYTDPYDPKLISTETRRLVSQPELGALVLFNSRNFHEVLPSHGATRRITLSSFIGRTEDGNLLLWS